jgi:hypothetical protein
MTPESVLAIINQAKRQEAQSGQFRRQVAARLTELPVIIRIDDPQPDARLAQFAVEYIEMAPRLIESVRECAAEARKRALFKPFLTAAINYFVQPSVLLSRYDGLDGLLIKAYLCHRLMEEMYENNRSFRNSQLVDVEATQANLLTHHLIGEPFANELDQSILITVRQIAGTPDYYELNLDPFVEQARHKAWTWMRDYWQNLLLRNHIEFQFSYMESPLRRRN